jgi:hypothetical protein
MTHKERFLRTMRFEPVDHVPDQEFGYWGETLQVWHDQGLPEWVTDDGKADAFFGFSPQHYAPFSLGIHRNEEIAAKQARKEGLEKV